MERTRDLYLQIWKWVKRERARERERERKVEWQVYVLFRPFFLLLLPPIISEVYKYMWVKKRENVQLIKITDNDKKNKFLPFSFSPLGQSNLSIIMSQSATLIRVAKHALDGTAIHPHNGQNTIYYQPFDLSSTSSNSTPAPKYLAYAIQRPREHVIPLASHYRIGIVRLYICISFAFEKKERRIWQFSRLAATQFSLSPFVAPPLSLCLIFVLFN